MLADERVKHLRDRLTQQGQRVTPQRLSIYNYLIKTDTHPTAEEIHRALRSQYPSMSPATVYKTLELLVDMGLVTEMGFGDSPNRYDGNPHDHINLVCTQCGRIVDLDEELLDDLRSKVTQSSSFKVQSQRHEYHGICPNCQ